MKKRWRDPSKNHPIPARDQFRLFRDVNAKGGQIAYDQLRRWTLSTVSVARSVAVNSTMHELSIPLLWIRLFGLLNEVRQALHASGQDPYGLANTPFGVLATTEREAGLTLIYEAWDELSDDERLFIETARHLQAHPQQWGRRIERNRDGLKDTIPVVLLSKASKQDIAIEALDAALARAVDRYGSEDALAANLVERLFDPLVKLYTWAQGT